MTGMQVTVLPTCATQVAAAPALPPGMAALSLPTRTAKDNHPANDECDDRNGDGRSRGTGSGQRPGRQRLIGRWPRQHPYLRMNSGKSPDRRSAGLGL